MGRILKRSVFKEDDFCEIELELRIGKGIRVKIRNIDKGLFMLIWVDNIFVCL